MKNFKKITTILLVLSIITACCFAFAGCNQTTDAPTKIEISNDISVVIENAKNEFSTYIVDTKSFKVNEKSTAADVLNYLSKNNELDVSIEGTKLTKLNNLVTTNDWSKWICIYTSDENQQDVSKYAETIKFMNNSITTAGFGITELKVSKGTILYFVQK